MRQGHNILEQEVNFKDSDSLIFMSQGSTMTCSLLSCYAKNRLLPGVYVHVGKSNVLLMCAFKAKQS